MNIFAGRCKRLGDPLTIRVFATAVLLASSSASTLGTTFRSETTSIVALPEAAARLFKAHLEKKSNKQTKSNREQVSLNDTKT